MSKKRVLILMTVGLVGLSGCETLMTRNEIDNKRQMQDSVSSLQKSNAETNNRFSDLESDLRSVTGRIEVLENRTQNLQGDKEKSKSLAEQNTSEQNKKIQILQDEVTRLSEAVATLSAEITAIKAANESEAASSSVKKDSFDQAEELFEKKEWKKAVLTYQKFRDSNPKSKKFAEATYKIGVCFQELGMKEDAKTFFDEVITKFANSPEAKKAKTRLKNIKK